MPATSVSVLHVVEQSRACGDVTRAWKALALFHDIGVLSVCFMRPDAFSEVISEEAAIAAVVAGLPN